MNTILLDTENINFEELNNIERLVKYKVIFFETPNTLNKKMPLTIVMKMLKAKMEVDILKVNVEGQNALDFQICAYAGMLKNEEDDIFILSHDKGFDNLKTFNMFRIDNINSLIKINMMEEEIIALIRKHFDEYQISENDRLVNDIKTALACDNKAYLNRKLMFNIKAVKENVTQEEINELYWELFNLLKE